MVCLSECNKKYSLLQQISLWEGCLVFCLSECTKKSSVLQLNGLWEAFLLVCSSEFNKKSLLQWIRLWAQPSMRRHNDVKMTS